MPRILCDECMKTLNNFPDHNNKDDELGQILYCFHMYVKLKNETLKKKSKKPIELNKI